MTKKVGKNNGQSKGPKMIARGQCRRAGSSNKLEFDEQIFRGKYLPLRRGTVVYWHSVLDWVIGVFHPPIRRYQ